MFYYGSTPKRYPFPGVVHVDERLVYPPPFWPCIPVPVGPSSGTCAWPTGCCPRRVVGFYVVGPAALGAYHPGRSDVDFVAVGDGDLGRDGVRRLRFVRVLSGAGTGARALRLGHVALPGMCNGVFVRADEVTRPVSRIRPLASRSGPGFAVGRGFDVNPVVWTVLGERGIAVRGPEPARLGLQPERDSLRRWNLDNLASCWEPWPVGVLASGRPRPGPLARSRAAQATRPGVRPRQ